MKYAGYIVAIVLVLVLLGVGIYYFFYSGKGKKANNELGNTTTQTELKVDVFNSGSNK